MKSAMMYLASLLFVSFLNSCGDLDSFVEPAEPALPRLPADDCGEFLADAEHVFRLRWSGNDEEIFLDTWNDIRAIRLNDKSARTVVGAFFSPKTLSVSADGQKVYFTAMNEQWQSGLYVVSSGGTPTLLRQDVYSALVSADQRIAVYSTSGSVYALELATGASRLLHTGEALALSDDGAYAVVRDFPAPYYNEMCYHVSTSTGSAGYFSLPSWNVWRYAWVGGELVAFTVEWVESGFRLRTWRSSNGQYSSPVYLSEGATMEAIDVSKDGNRVVWWGTTCTSLNSWGGCDLQELRLHGTSLATLKDTTLATAYTRFMMYGALVALSGDGKRVALLAKGRLYVKDVM